MAATTDVEAFDLFDPVATVDVAKTVWASPAGKKRLQRRLCAMLPKDHATFCEPFVGSGAVTFGMEPVAREAVNDIDPEIAQAYRDLKALTPEEVRAMYRKNWIASAELFKRLAKQKPPESRVDRLHRFVYLANFAYGKLRGKSFNHHAAGQRAKSPERIEKFHGRVKNFDVYCGDYTPVVQQYDGKDSLYFFDPPYAGSNVQVGEDKFDEVAFRKILDGLQGRFLLTYGVTGKLVTKGFNVRRILPPRSIRTMRGVMGMKTLPTLLISNYELLAKRMSPLDDDWEFEDAVADATCEFDKARFPALTMPDPDYLVARLAARQPAAVLSAINRDARIGLDQALVNERVVPEQDLSVHAIVKMMAPLEVASLDRLEKRWQESLDEITHAEFVAREASGEGPFRLYPLVLVRQFAEPRLIEDRVGEAKRGGPGALARPHPCKYCDAEATRALIWADGRAFIPICPDHEAKARDTIAENHDTVCEVRDLPVHDEKSERRPGESVSECVARKIPILIEEGMPQAQAVAVAHRLCGAPKPTAKAEWTTAYINDLADAAFLHISAGGKKDADGKTVPRSLRHFPVRDKDGTLDLPHLRNAIARIPQTTAPDLSAQERERLQAEARSLLDQTQKSDTHHIRLIKAERSSDEERFVLGVVLEPEVEDTQGDIYSPEEVRNACHHFMEDARKIGYMHRSLLGQGAAILENYITPVAFQINGQAVKAGTWLLGLRIHDKGVWQDIKDGTITGYSIGGSALRQEDEGK